MSLNSDPVIGASDGAAVTERHPIYYFEFVRFKVERILFCVPKNDFIRFNPKFFDPFNLPGPPSDNANSDSNAIELDGVTAQAFEGLLQVLHPCYGTTTTYEQWLGALELATLWDFQEIRTKSIDTLSSMNQNNPRTTIEIIQLAKKYRIKSWLREGYIKLVQQRNTDLDDLIDALGYETSTRIFAAQSYLLQTSFSVQPEVDLRCGNCSNCNVACSCSSCQAKPKGPCLEPKVKPVVPWDDYEKAAAEVDRVFRAELSALE